jgi:tRNA-specific 2-thiouridylase
MAFKKMVRENMKRVVVGMSGGVDSSVAAYLLKEQGYEVIGLFMRNWNDASVTREDECPWIDDSRDAMLVAEQLGIPFQVIDFSTSYKERIVDYMFKEYESGRTPNPDVLCNREIKFDLFLKEALKLGAHFVATGHYVRKGVTQLPTGETFFQLLRGHDPGKDQSYFLCQLNQEQLAKALFPIGELQKSEVRAIALRLGLVTADKKDSQGLCFIGKVRLPDFLQQQLKTMQGKVIEISDDISELKEYRQIVFHGNHEEAAPCRLSLRPDMGNVVGTHQGAHFYTRGQRRGLQIGGMKLPLFVLQTDTVNNIIYVGQGEEHSGLFYRGLKIDSKEIHWVRPLEWNEAVLANTFKGQLRYRQEAFECQLHVDSDGNVRVVFKEPQKNVTPGQFFVLYLEDELVLSAVISE